MKTLLLLASLCITTFTQAAEVEPSGVWVDSIGNYVFYIPAVEANVELVRIKDETLEIDQTFMKVTVGLTDELKTRQLKALKDRYPGKSIVALTTSSTTWKLSIPSISKTLPALPDEGGLTAIFESDALSEVQIRELKTHWEDHDIVVLNATVDGRLNNPLERVELPEISCQELISERGRVVDLLAGLQRIVDSRVKKLSMKYPETRDNLLASLLYNCADFADVGKVETATQFLEGSIRPISRGLPIRGEARMRQQSVNLKYVLHRVGR